MKKTEAGPQAKRNLTWRTSHLPPLPDRQVAGLVEVMSAWYQDREPEIQLGPDPGVFWQYLDRQGLAGFLGAQAWDGRPVPGPLGQPALHRYLSNQLHWERARRVLEKVVTRAREMEIGLTLFKGPALVHQGYLDGGVRAFSDIDLFARSREDVIRLARALGQAHLVHSTDRDIIGRLGESEAVSFVVDDWELEFRYPLDPPGEPMFEILLEHQDRLMTVPHSVDHLLDPDPNVHLVFLIQHMAVHHLFSRFFWFLDLAVLVRRQRDRLDPDAVQRDLDRMGLRNAAAVTSAFCRRHFDPEFLVFEPKRPAWNLPIMASMTEPRHIYTGKFGIYHRGFLWKTQSMIFGILGFYLVADPPPAKLPWGGFGTVWTLNRFRCAFGFAKPIPWVDKLLGPMFTAVLLPAARLAASVWRRLARGPRSRE